MMLSREISNQEIARAQAEFLAAILKPDLTAALAITHHFILSSSDITTFWEKVIQPSLYEVGLKWERNEIVHQQEHLATSICSRVIREYEPIIHSLKGLNKRVLITCTSFEKHTVGMKMLGHILELNGIRVQLALNSQIDGQDIKQLITESEIDAVIFSTTMYENIIHTEQFIENIKSSLDHHHNPFFISGGQAFNRIDSNTAQVVASMFGKAAADLYLFTATQLISFLTEKTERFESDFANKEP